MNWKEVKTISDVEHLNELFSVFHESYLKELCFFSGSYVGEDLKMHLRKELTARLVFQRTCDVSSAVELKFRDVIQINITPASEYEFAFIMEAPLHMVDDNFYWNSNDFPIHDDRKNDFTWILAKQVFWRVREDLLGDKQVYLSDSVD